MPYLKYVTIDPENHTIQPKVCGIYSHTLILYENTSQLMDDRLKEARKRAKKKKDFYGSLVAFAISMPFLVFLNITTSPDHLWFFYPLFGWGISLAFQYWDSFGKGRLSGDWEERQIQKELDEMDRNGPSVKRKMDDHLDLRELEKKREKQAEWRDQDLV